jgi:hypothetical protein
MPLNPQANVFASAMSSLLSPDAGAALTAPVLGKRKQKEIRKMASQKKKKKDARLRVLERRAAMDKGLVVPTRGMVGERALRKTATRGVVALFNAVRAHQRTAQEAEESAASLASAERRRVADSSKEKFLAALRRGKEDKAGVTVTGKITVRGSTADDETVEEQGPSGRKKEGAEAPGGFLDEKLLLGAKMKDWDVSSDEEA